MNIEFIKRKADLDEATATVKPTYELKKKSVLEAAWNHMLEGFKNYYSSHGFTVNVTGKRAIATYKNINIVMTPETEVISEVGITFNGSLLAGTDKFFVGAQGTHDWATPNSHEQDEEKRTIVALERNLAYYTAFGEGKVNVTFKYFIRKSTVNDIKQGDDFLKLLEDYFK